MEGVWPAGVFVRSRSIPIITSCLLCVTRDNWRHQLPGHSRARERDSEREDQEDSLGEIQIPSVWPIHKPNTLPCKFIELNAQQCNQPIRNPEIKWKSMVAAFNVVITLRHL